jgi:assimilatory nitrate reductase catalytic subunit
MGPGLKETKSTCPYCGVGCGVIIQSQGGQITGVRGDTEHPANFGRLCTKGSTLHLTATADVTHQARPAAPDAARAPRRGASPRQLGRGARTSPPSPSTRSSSSTGRTQVGFYLSGQLLTEDYYVFNKLAKGLLATNNVDTNSRFA